MSKTKQKDFCPLVKKPWPACYCFTLSSRDINNAVFYCYRHYRKCDVYIKNIEIYGDSDDFTSVKDKGSEKTLTVT